MDITDQLGTFGDAFLPDKAAAELADLRKDYAPLGDAVQRRGKEIHALRQRMRELEAVARFIVNNRNNFTIRDTDGVAGSTIDQLAVLLEQP